MLLFTPAHAFVNALVEFLSESRVLVLFLQGPYLFREQSSDAFVSRLLLRFAKNVDSGVQALPAIRWFAVGLGRPRDDVGDSLGGALV